jgi:hypothetical protein
MPRIKRDDLDYCVKISSAGIAMQRARLQKLYGAYSVESYKFHAAESILLIMKEN